MAAKKRIEKLINDMRREIYWASKCAEDAGDKEMLENDLKDLLNYYEETFGEKYHKE